MHVSQLPEDLQIEEPAVFTFEECTQLQYRYAQGIRKGVRDLDSSYYSQFDSDVIRLVIFTEKQNIDQKARKIGGGRLRD
jgi:hypothetical protein